MHVCVCVHLCTYAEFKIRNYKYLDTWPNTFQSIWPFPKVFGPLIHVYSLLPIIIDHMNDITTCI